MSAAAVSEREVPRGFRHEALFYEADRGFLAGAVPFIREGVARGEAVMVAVEARKIDMLRTVLDGDAGGRVRFADMARIGANPARIIPAWRDFVDEHAGAGVRGIGEPISPARRPAELVECQHHETLLNLEFSDGAPLWLVCPYDTETLDRHVIDRARRSHPRLRHGRIERTSPTYAGEEGFGAVLDDALPPPDGAFDELEFDERTLDEVRRFVILSAAGAGVEAGKAIDVVLAVNEVASNSVLHGGGRGVLRAWDGPDGFVCEVADAGTIDRPLVGRERPPLDAEGGRGLWLANQLCDLVQVRSSEAGTVVRVHAWRA